MRLLLILLAALVAAAGAATAQVAAPSLIPTPTFTQNPSNPAVLSWDMPSRVGAMYSKLEVNDPMAPFNPVADGDLKSVQAQYVGDVFAAGAFVGSANIADKQGGGMHSTDFSTVQAAVQFGDWISFGIGQEQVKNEDFQPASSYHTADEGTLPHGGATLRVAQVLYLGVAGGTGKYKRTDFASPGPSAEISRGVLRYGVAYHFSDKSGGLHLEAFKEERDKVNDPVAMVMAPKETTTGGTAEGKLGSVVVGYTSNKQERPDPTGVNPPATQETKTVLLGWAPEQGLAITLAASKLESSPNNGPPEIKFTSIGASWLF